MKWCSIKEFLAPTDTWCLIFTENNYTYVARLPDKDNPDCWVHDYDCEECQNSSHEKIYGVTHFCVIEPVPINKPS